MASANGRLSTASLTAIPAEYHTHGTTAYLRADAAAAFLRVAAAFEKKFGKRLVAMSFYRPYEDQVRIFLKNYTRVSRARSKKTDRSYNGSTYALRSGMSPVASPGYSNHGLAVTVDFNSGVQTRGSAEFNWMNSEGVKYGWDWTEGKRIGEPWHRMYVPSADRMKNAPSAAVKVEASKPATSKPAASVSAPVKDVTATQKALADLGYYMGKVDGVSGTATTAAVKAFQNDAGLTADGVAGPETRKTLEDFMSKIDDLYAVAVENQKRITRILDAVENGKAGVRSDGTLVSLLKSQHKETLGIIAPGQKGVRTDGSLVNVIKTEARKS